MFGGVKHLSATNMQKKLRNQEPGNYFLTVLKVSAVISIELNQLGLKLNITITRRHVKNDYAYLLKQ